ncbi:hypothetical protein [Nocardia sp. CS682]|uniref:hypothetical protein n=1 Tax=Nocardia sp. CS682 TaxID=1047172 RepID=UPI001074B1B9|nr:hypothetical protein [Nocardia sp. CS682]QBS39822.1 hypothetical protein DMB37_06410 [Nocardia sp. CS682]
MDAGGWVVVFFAVAPFFAAIGLMIARYVRIRRYGRHGGEYNDPFPTAGGGGLAPGTVFQQDFGGTGTSQPSAAAGASEPLTAAPRRSADSGEE